MDLGKASFTFSANVEGQPALDKLNKTIGETGQRAGISAKQTREAFRQLPNQLTDVVTQLAGGQNPLLVLIQQGGQVKDSFGGIVPAVRALLSTLTPLRLAIGGIAGAATLLGAAFYTSEKRAEDLSRALALTGNNAGLTKAQFEAMIQSVQKAAGVTAGIARELSLGAASSGAFSPQTIQSVTVAMAQLQRVSGRAADEIIGDFAGMRDGVTKWAEEKNRAYNFLTPEVYKQIRALEQQGDREEAIQLATAAFTDAFQKRTVQLGFFAKAWKEVKEAASGAWEAVTGVFEGDTPEKRIAQIEKELNALADARVKSMGGVAAASAKQSAYEQALEKELAGLKATKKATEDKAKAEADAAKATRDTITAEKIRDALIGPNATAFVEKQKAAGEARIRALDLEISGVERLRARDLIGEQEAADRILALKTKQAQEEVKIAQAKVAAEQGRRIAETDPVQRAVAQAEQANRIAAAKAELDAASAKIPALAAQAAIDTAERDTKEAEKAFDRLGVLYRSGAEELLAAQAEVERARIALIKDPVARANAELDQQIKETQQRYDKLIDKLQRDLLEAQVLAGGTEVEAIKARIDQLKALREAATGAINEGRPKTGYFEGAKEGLRDWLMTAKDVAGQIKSAVGNALDGLTDVLTEWVTTGKASFRDFARSVLTELTKILIRQQLVKAGQAAMSYFGFADGGAFSGGTQAFAKGGVVGGPTLFKFAQGGQMRQGLMGEAGPEAIMPLRRTANGRLGVEVAGGGGGSNTVIVNVNAQTGQTDVTSDAESLGRLGKLIGDRVRQVMIEERRPGGLLTA